MARIAGHAGPTRMVCLILGLAVVSGCAGVQREPAGAVQRVPAQPPAPGDESEVLESGVIHVVEPGQTLWRIARVYGVPLDEVVAANGIDDPTRLEVGRGLWIPGAREVLEVVPYPAPPVAAGPGVVAGSITFAWPVVGGRLLAGFGESRRTHRHQGLDIAGSRGQKIVAAARGRVVYSDDRMRGYGKTVIVDHGNGYRSLYAHNSKLLVRMGDEVGQGQAIAILGRTGNATGEHCHFEIRRDRVPVDPLPYLPGSMQ